MSDRPEHVEAGQRWGLETFEGALYERMTVVEVGLVAGGRYAHAWLDGGGQCVVGVDRLLTRGDYIGRARACNARPPDGHPLAGSGVACHRSVDHVDRGEPHSWEFG